MTPPEINVRVLPYRDGIQYPKRATLGSAGYDIFSPDDVVIPPNEVARLNLGFGLQVEDGYYASLQTRSSLSIKHGIVLANGTEGVVDSDYTDEIILALYNRSSEPFHIAAGDRVAQLLFKQYYVAYVTNLDPLEDNRFIPRVSLDPFNTDWAQGISVRSGGLGSTGK